MLVETYEIEEPDTHPEVESRSLELIEELGLEGQKELISPNTGKRSPYREMTKQEQEIFEILLPRSVDYQEYKQSSIPHRVLEVIALAKDHFDHLKIWDKENSEVDDPILVGYLGSNTWSATKFLLARWGESLDEMPALIKQAAAIHKQKLIQAQRKAIAELQAITYDNLTDTEIISARVPSSYC